MPLSAEQDAFIYELRLLLSSLESCLFAALSPEPSKEEIEREVQKDRNKNPHNDPHKPRLREYDEIIAHIKFRKAAAMSKVKNELYP
jgi:hypothetical protein